MGKQSVAVAVMESLMLVNPHIRHQHSRLHCTVFNNLTGSNLAMEVIKTDMLKSSYSLTLTKIVSYINVVPYFKCLLINISSFRNKPMFYACKVN